MARRLYPFLPAQPDNEAAVPGCGLRSRLNSPVLVIHSIHDEIIPFSMGQAIYAAVSQQKEFLQLRAIIIMGF